MFPNKANFPATENRDIEFDTYVVPSTCILYNGTFVPIPPTLPIELTINSSVSVPESEEIILKSPL